MSSKTTANASKLLPTDRTALARQRLQEKMAAKQKQKDEAQQQDGNNNSEEDEDDQESNSSESSQQDQKPSSPPPATATTTEEQDLSCLVPKPRSKQQQQSDSVASPITPASPSKTLSPDAKEDLDAILHEDDDEDETEAEAAQKTSSDVVEAYDEFNLVDHDKKNQNDDDQEQGSPVEWEDHGRLLSEVQKEEEALLNATKQHFDYFLLIDFECTCDERAGWDNEIIEMPALLYDTTKLKIVAEFHTYIKPLRNPVLTPFCNQLTGIRQEQVENAPCYDEAVKSLVVWLQETLAALDPKKPNNKRTDGTRLCVATDGPCDLEVFGYLFMHIRDGFAFPNFFQRYLDVKQVFRDEYGEGKYRKIKDMLATFGLKFRGNQHSGIDDTRNLGTIVTQMIRRGTVFNDVYYVTNTSGKRRVPAYIWNRAKQTVKRATERRRIGIGPKLADRCRAGFLGLSDAEVAARGSLSISSLLQQFAFLRIKVRPGEYSNAPSTALLVLVICAFLASFFL